MTTTDHRSPQGPRDEELRRDPGARHGRAGSQDAPADSRSGQPADSPSGQLAGELTGELAGMGSGGSTPGGVHPIIKAVHDCLTALSEAKESSTLSLSAEELKVLILAVAQIISQALALKLKLLVAGDSKRVADTIGATSTPAFLAFLTQSTRRQASGEVRLAKDLDRRFPILLAAMEAGAMSLEQVRVCVTALRKLPKDLPADQLDACQHFLADAALTFDPDGLARQARRLWEVIDPEGADEQEGRKLQDEEDLARARAFLKSWRNGDGTTSFKGKLPDVQFDMLMKAIEAFAAPRRRSNPNIRTTSGTNRAKSPDGPDADDRDRPGDGLSDDATTAGGQPTGGPPDPLKPRLFNGVEDEEVLEPETGRKLPYPIVLGHGLMDFIEHMPVDHLPRSGGIAATIVVTMQLDALLTGLGAATLDTGTKLSASQARRMACDAGLIPLVLDGDSQPLDVGREQRLHDKYQRVAMAHRDKGCVAEGCDRPPAWCEGHHLTPWKDGGRTCVEDGCLGCWYHHHLFHHPDWTTTRLPSGKFRFRRSRYR